MNEPTVRCRFCGEEILAVAIKCKHCKSDLGMIPMEPAEQVVAPPADFGLVLLAIPAVTTALMWFWIGNMSLLHSPGAWLGFCAVLTIAATALLAAIEDGKARGSTDAKWVAVLVLVWAIGYPGYLGHREKHGLKDLRLPGILIAALFIGSLFYLQHAINEAERNVAFIGAELNQSIAEIESTQSVSMTETATMLSEPAEAEPPPPVEVAAIAAAEPGAADPAQQLEIVTGLYAASADQLLVIGKGEGSSIDVTLTLGSGGRTDCVEGDVSCLSIDGVGQWDGAAYVVTSIDDCTFRVALAQRNLVVAGPQGICGTGTGNRHQLAAFASTYAPLCKAAGSNEWRACDGEAPPP